MTFRFFDVSTFLVIGLGLAIAAPTQAARSRKKIADAATAAADERSLGSQIAALATSPRVGAMQVGIRVELLGSRPTLIYEQKADQPFKPASNEKIVTSGAGLTLLPANFTYRTVLARRRDDLVVIGAGDPATGDPRMAAVAKQKGTLIFRQWAEALKAKGMDRISGDLLFDDYIFEQQHLHPDWAKQFKNMQDWYCAPVGGLNFNDNCIEVLVKPAARPGEPADVELYPPNNYVHLENKTRTSSKGEPIINRLASDPNTILVSGPVSRANTPEYAPSVAMVDPGLLFAGVCKTVLAREGIEIAGQIRRVRVRAADLSIPPDLQTIAVHEQKLSEMMWRIDKSSLNMFAEALLKTLGAYDASGKPVAVGSYENGRTAIMRWLDRLGIKRDTYVIDDGSGLSHGNRVTPNELVAILKVMNAGPRREEWWANLAEPGGEGTLKKRLKGYQGKVYAKTGSIGGVSSLSGYVKAAEGRIYVFSILCNDTTRSKGLSPHELQDAICKLLASH